jgi:hypothetical protein
MDVAGLDHDADAEVGVPVGMAGVVDHASGRPQAKEQDENEFLHGDLLGARYGARQVPPAVAVHRATGGRGV